jgi:L-ectoine synthase
MRWAARVRRRTYPVSNYRSRHDQHGINARTRMRLLCVFTLPLVGGEVHDADGAYPLLYAVRHRA